MRRVSSTLISVVLVLLAVGIVMLASTSSVKGWAKYGDAHFFVKRQALWVFLAVAVGAAVSQFDYHWWRKRPVVIALGGLSLLLLGLVIIPGVGTRIGGSYRWLRVGPLSFQPSELAKFSLVTVLCVWMAEVGRRASRFKEGLLYPLAGIGLVTLLLMMEPDFGTTLLCGVVGMSILFAAGTRLSYLAITSALGLGAFALAITRNEVRMARILAFLMPERYPVQAYHLGQSKVAFIRGGWFGVGLGNSIQKQFYLPEAHTDFILAIIGEELGLAATGAVAALFVAILVCGMLISFKAPDHFGRLLAFGFTLMLVLQAVINIGVVTGCLPTKGLALPFISYGGSSLLISAASVGVLLNVAKHISTTQPDPHTRAIKNKARRL